MLFHPVYYILDYGQLRSMKVTPLVETCYHNYHCVSLLIDNTFIITYNIFLKVFDSGWFIIPLLYWTLSVVVSIFDKHIHSISGLGSPIFMLLVVFIPTDFVFIFIRLVTRVRIEPRTF
jgi:hypothetical protein